MHQSTHTHSKKSLINLVIENHVCSVYMGGGVNLKNHVNLVYHGYKWPSSHLSSWKKRQSANNRENLLILVTLYWQMTLFFKTNT
jgi:hypothetical protein